MNELDTIKRALLRVEICRLIRELRGNDDPEIAFKVFEEELERVREYTV